ncbi:hypothetical protein [Rheinheimera salexigens]|uniref:Uncharacterized protein n=1 Tax=Rheinheimera salexigens TaxID=1628148 RepID=A0A1E7Q3X7_9GAMM|nr:hypothetical protein [Rheinheimera salexigens]OEY68831.1 hypothetical protein BI198_04075 [Rheinheimera salexigens]
MNINSPLLQLALLESLKANKISDEIDLFLPFIAVTLSELGRLEVTAELLQEQLAKSFGFRPPLSAVQVFITRAKKRRLLHRENHAFIPNIEEVDKWKNGYHEKKDDITASLELLRIDFIDFAHSKFNKTLTSEECDLLIIQFIDKNISSVTDNKSYEKNVLREKIKNTDHVTASFISYIHKNKTASLEHFARFVKGMLLANYLCLADKVGQKKNYKSITVYIDTPIIVGLLGFSGTQKQKSLKEFISLLVNVGININVFDKSIDETEGLLSAWRDDLKQKNYKRFNTKTLELLRYLGYDAERLDTEIKLLRSSVEKIGIVVKSGFNIKQQFQCDEIALEKAISPNFRPTKNLQHDTICISRIYNIRENKTVNNLNQPFTVFVTTNNGLVNLANKHFINEIPRNSIPLVVSEQWMTAMFWLKKPELFGNLPMEQVISSAYGLLYTDDKFWESFIKKLEHLERKGKITEEDLVQVRWDSDLLSMVHDVSVDVGEDFTDDDVFEIVAAIKNKHIEDKDREILEIHEVKNNEISLLQENINVKEKQLIATEERHKKIAIFLSFIPALIVIIFLTAVVFISAVIALPSELLPAYIKPELQSHSITLLSILIVFFLNFLGSFYDLNFRTIFKSTQNLVFNRIYRLLQGEVDEH